MPRLSVEDLVDPCIAVPPSPRVLNRVLACFSRGSVGRSCVRSPSSAPSSIVVVRCHDMYEQAGELQILLDGDP